MNEAYQDALLKVDSYGAIFMYATHKDLTTAPRHIIRTMVEMMEPNPARGETICDPFCWPLCAPHLTAIRNLGLALSAAIPNTATASCSGHPRCCR